MTLTPKTAIYARVSSDDGSALGVRRQEADCRKLAKSRKLDVSGAFVDNDTSAFARKPRPAFEAMLAAIGAGEITTVLAWANDRLYRRVTDQLRLLEALEAVGGAVETVKDGSVDPTTASGRMTMGLLANISEFESARKSERALRKSEEIAADGKPSGGGLRPFGFEPGGMKVRPDEAKLIRRAVRDILAGRSMRSAAANTPWTPQTLKRIVTGWRIAGWRAHHGEPVAPAQWPAIVSRADVERVRSILSGNPRQRGAYRYLLSGGLSTCSLCGTGLVAQPRYSRTGALVRGYVCSKDTGGCGRIRVKAEPLEDLVVAEVMEVLNSDTLRKMLAAALEDSEDTEVLTEISADEDGLAELTHARYVKRQIGEAEFVAARRELEARLDANRRRLARSMGSKVLTTMNTANTVGTAYAAMNIDQRRELLGLLIERVEVGPARRGLTTFDPDRVAIVWRA